VNRNVADSNEGREASEGSLRTSRKVFEAILVVERGSLGGFWRNRRSFWGFREEAGDRVVFLESKWLKERVFYEH
jgi:hypothetical protein